MALNYKKMVLLYTKGRRYCDTQASTRPDDTKGSIKGEGDTENTRSMLLCLWKIVLKEF